MSSFPTALTINVDTQTVVKSQTFDGYGLTATDGVSWTSSNSAVASVQNVVNVINAGLITAVSVGSCNITATAGSATAVFYVTVIVPVNGTASVVEISADQAYQPTKKLQ